MAIAFCPKLYNQTLHCRGWMKGILITLIIAVGLSLGHLQII